MSISWRKYRLDEIAKISMGQSPKSQFYNKDGIGLPFFQGKTEFREYYPLVKQFTSKTTKKAAKNDILFTVRAPVGELNIANQDCCIGRGLAAIQAKNINENKFLYYILKVSTGLFLSRSSGAIYDAIDLNDLKSSEFFIPSNSQERIKIAKILSNYDDLIENNLKRIRLLEESARHTYEEWFLRFRIDGKKLDIDPDTNLPFGWELVKVGSLLQPVNTSVKIKSSEILKSGKNPVVDQSTDFIAGYTNESNIIQFKDNPFIVFGDHTRILKFVNFSFARGADGTQILISNNPRIPQTLFYHSLLAIDLSNYHYARHFKFLKEEKVIVPKEFIATKYNIICTKIFNQVKNLRNQNHLLKEARDILLPRLMTGMIDTDELDIAV